MQAREADSAKKLKTSPGEIGKKSSAAWVLTIVSNKGVCIIRMTCI